MKEACIGASNRPVEMGVPGVGGGCAPVAGAPYPQPFCDMIAALMRNDSSFIDPVSLGGLVKESREMLHS